MPGDGIWNNPKQRFWLIFGVGMIFMSLVLWMISGGSNGGGGGWFFGGGGGSGSIWSTSRVFTGAVFSGAAATALSDDPAQILSDTKRSVFGCCQSGSQQGNLQDPQADQHHPAAEQRP